MPWVRSTIRNGKWKPALSEYDNALEINPKLLIASHNRGLTLARQRKLDAAIVQWQANLGQDATFIPSRLALARAYFRRNPAEARKQYDAILELQKQDPAAAARTHAEMARLQYCRADLAGRHAGDAQRDQAETGRSFDRRSCRRLTAAAVRGPARRAGNMRRFRGAAIGSNSRCGEGILASVGF